VSLRRVNALRAAIYAGILDMHMNFSLA